MKRLLSSIAFCMLILINLPNTVDASSNVTTEKEILINYLEAVKNQELDTVLALVNDTRFSTLEELKQEYKYLLSTDKLITYNINEGKNNSEFIVEVNFENGEISQIPFKVLDNKVNISFESLENNDYKVIQEGIEENISPRHTYCDWNFSQRRHDSSFYSNCKFNISGTSSLTLYLTQETNYASNTPAITYAIVDQGIFGDDVWGSVYVKGKFTDFTEKKISGKNDNFKNAQIRFGAHSLPIYDYYSGFGSIIK